MLSSMIGPGAGAGDSSMPGEYEPWPRNAALGQPPVLPPPRPFIPPSARPIRRPPIVPMAPPIQRGPPIRPARPPIRMRRHRPRPLTPDIVIERRHGHCRPSNRHRVITVPLDNRPTLGLRGPPRRVLEIERVRCHRRRRYRSPCSDDQYYGRAPQPVVVANAIPNPCLPPIQQPLQAFGASTFVPRTARLPPLTREMIENLPRQTVHLPPIHLPGSQADANTGLVQVIFPAEIINPADGSLSIIQGNSAAGGGIGFAQNIQPAMSLPIQPQLISAPVASGISPQFIRAPITTGGSPQFIRAPITTGGSPQFIRAPSNTGAPLAPGGPPVPPAMTGDPLVQRFRELLRQRLTPAQTQQPSIPNPSNIRPTLPAASQFNPTNTPANTGPYSPANITPSNAVGVAANRLANAGFLNQSGNAPSRSANNASYNTTSNPQYSPANITPSNAVGIAANRLENAGFLNQSGNAPYRSANNASNNSTSNPAYRPSNFPPSNASDIGPYRPANITPYRSSNYQSAGNTTGATTAPGINPYQQPGPLTSSASFTSPSGLYSSPSALINSTFSSPSFPASGPYQMTNPSTPRSILRNNPSTALSNTTYARLNPPNVSSSNDIVRKRATFV